MCSWGSLHTACSNQNGQKGPCPPNQGDLCSDHWLPLLITEVQKAGGHCCSSSHHCCKPFTLQLMWLLVDLKSRHPRPFIVFVFLFGSQILKTRTFKSRGIIRKWLYMPGKDTGSEKPWEDLCLHFRLILGTEIAYNNKTMITKPKTSKLWEGAESDIQSYPIFRSKCPVFNNNKKSATKNPLSGKTVLQK